MTHLNDVIEQFDAGHLMVLSHAYPAEDTPLEMVEKATKLMPNAMCFDIGTEHGVVGLCAMKGLFRLPYETCWFETQPTNTTDDLAHIGMLASTAEGGGVSIYFFKRGRPRSDPWAFLGVARELAEHDSAGRDALRGRWWPNNPVFLVLAKLLWAYLSALNCVNVRRVETKPDEKLQRARARRGKAPLFSYWTLCVDLDRDPASPRDSGGSHASPRLHLRRGHARQFAPGRWTWVSACAVGNKSAGMVHKEYSTKRDGRSIQEASIQ